MTPDRVAERLAPPEAPAPRPETRARIADGPIPIESSEVETRPDGLSRRGRSAHQPLARLERFRPLKRAVVLAEILGAPRSTSDDPPARRGSR